MNILPHSRLLRFGLVVSALVISMFTGLGSVYRAAAIGNNEIKYVAFAPDGKGWVLLFGKNGYAVSKGTPQPLIDLLGQINDRNFELKQVVFTPDGKGWIVLWDKNGFNTEQAPTKMVEQLDDLNKRGQEIKYVTFSSDGEGWLVPVGDKGYAASKIADDVTNKLDDLNSRQNVLKGVAFQANPKDKDGNPAPDDWVILFGANAASWSDNVLKPVVAKIRQINDDGGEIRQVAFTPDGQGWVVISAYSVAWSDGLPTDLVDRIRAITNNQ